MPTMAGHVHEVPLTRDNHCRTRWCRHTKGQHTQPPSLSPPSSSATTASVSPTSTHCPLRIHPATMLWSPSHREGRKEHLEKSWLELPSSKSLRALRNSAPACLWRQEAAPGQRQGSPGDGMSTMGAPRQVQAHPCPRPGRKPPT